MNVNAESYGHAVILHCRGELTCDSLEAFRHAVDHQLLAESQVHDVVLDLEAVPFVDSATLEYFLELQEQLNDRLGQVKLARLDENVAKILQITRLDQAFEVCADVAEVVKNL